MSHAIVNASLLHKTFLWPIASCLKGKFLTVTHTSLLTQFYLPPQLSLPWTLGLHLHWTIFQVLRLYFNHLQSLTILVTHHIIHSSHSPYYSPYYPSRKLFSHFPPHALFALFTNSKAASLQQTCDLICFGYALSMFPDHIIFCSTKHLPHYIVIALLPVSACRLFALWGQGPGVAVHHCIPSK